MGLARQLAPYLLFAICLGSPGLDGHGSLPDTVPSPHPVLTPPSYLPLKPFNLLWAELLAQLFASTGLVPGNFNSLHSRLTRLGATNSPNLFLLFLSPTSERLSGTVQVSAAC